MFVVCTAVVAAPWPRASRAHAPVASAVSAAPSAPSDSSRARDQLAPSSNPHFLRDAVAGAGFAAAPEDTTDDEFLPEEHDTKKLIWDITAWVIGAALVAFFIIKVFIEKDPDESDGGGSTKPDPF